MRPDATNDELLNLLLLGEAEVPDISRLAEGAAEDSGLAARIAGELSFSEMLRLALAPDAEAFPDRFGAAVESSLLPMEELFARASEGCATKFECDQIAKHLWGSPDAAIVFRRQLAEDEWIREALSESRGPGAFVESLETRMWAETERDRFVDDFTRRLDDELTTNAAGEPAEGKIIPFPAEWTRSLLQVGAVAAVLSFGAFVAAKLVANHHTSRTAPAEVVKSSLDVDWSEGASPDRNGFIQSGLYHLNRGVVSMRLSSGSELTVEGPAVFEVGEDSSTFVHEGIALARNSGSESGVSLRSRGLRVSEPASMIGIDARVDGATEAIVFSGDGGICLTEGGQCRELSRFEAVKADHFNEKLVDVPYNPHAFANAWALLSGVQNNLGSVSIEMPGSDISSERGEEGQVQVFVENESFRPETDLEVDRVEIGEFSVAEANPGQHLQAKGDLRSYLLQLWPSDRDGGKEVETSLTFDHPVVGVIFSSGRLVSSDSSVGSANTPDGKVYSTGQGMDSGNDEILLSQDRRTLNLRFKGDGHEAGQVRVLVALN